MKIIKYIPFLLLLMVGRQVNAQTAVRVDFDLTKDTRPVSPYIYNKNNVLATSYLSSSIAEYRLV